MSAIVNIAASPNATHRPLWLIMSGAYVGQELGAELGQVPPAMMPIGHSRLYELQLETIAQPADIWIVFPEGFTLPEEDERRLNSHNAKVIALPAGLSLGAAVIYALNYIGASDHDLRILHGDTLIYDVPAGTDVIAIAQSTDEYRWADVDTVDGTITRIHTEIADGNVDRRDTACGYFACSSSTELVRSILRAGGDFVAGLNTYSEVRALRAAKIGRWLDFGHLQTFFQSRRMVTTAREFNDIAVGRVTVRKSSRTNPEKIRAEAHWLDTAPPELQPFCSRVLDQGADVSGAFYETEYEYMLTLSELYLFGSLGKGIWSRIIMACAEFLNASAKMVGKVCGDRHLRVLTQDKTIERLEAYARTSNVDIDAPTSFNGRRLPSLRAIATDLNSYIDFDSGRSETVMHGDFCFSNIFYNSRSQRVRLIDPRGYVENGTPSLFGDLRYDLAKLSHSVVGRYDQILAGRYRCSGMPGGDMTISFEETPIRAWLEGAFGELTIAGASLSGNEVHAVMTGLFLSMLPLHSDRVDRQRAFIANALRLYCEL